ncbi:Dirigent protein 15 [Hibiscus syriacus]|uniref:Dirigent protein n=1 Tax=Hibiscus syriacus TaxID=106335 RepID=A0A6A3B7F5_HIBSY|nr:Dirigent protein 15 [Hibiscus syriacus]
MDFAAAAAAAGGVSDFGFDVDPNIDPELALALRVSMEEERARREAAAKRAAEEAGRQEKGEEAQPQSDSQNATSTATEKTSDPMDEDDALLKQALALSMNIPGSDSSAGDAQTSEETNDDQELALASGGRPKRSKCERSASIFAGPIRVARPNVTTASNDTFGSVVATDDLLTIGPNVTSRVIGNAQGLWVSTGREVSCLTVYMDFGFTVGEFNGSSISIFSRNPVSQTERELAVVGGRGKFRMAQGYAQLKTYYVNFTTGDAIVEYKVTVIH